MVIYQPIVSGSLTITGSAIISGSMTVTSLTGNSALVTDTNDQLVSSATTATEIGYLSGVTTNITNFDDITIIKAYQSLGSSIKGTTLTCPSISLLTTTTGMSTGILRMNGVYISKPATITGIKWFQTTAVSAFVAQNYNGVGLYTTSGGTLTCVASSSNSSGFWSTSANTWTSQSFSFGSNYSATPGVYYVGIVAGYSSGTGPSIGTAPAVTQANTFIGDFTNNNKISGLISSQTTMPASIALSSLTQTSAANLGLFIY